MGSSSKPILQYDNQPRVLLIDAEPLRRSILNRGLIEFNYAIVDIIKDEIFDLEARVEECQPDVIVVGIDLPDKDTLKKIASMHKNKPQPVVMFAEKDTPQIIQETVKSGINAFIVGDIQPQRLPSIINIAIARFKERQSLKTELQVTKDKLEERKIIEKAKGLLMTQRQLNEEESYKILRKMAMDKGQSLAKVAENIIDVFKLLDV